MSVYRGANADAGDAAVLTASPVCLRLSPVCCPFTPAQPGLFRDARSSAQPKEQPEPAPTRAFLYIWAPA